jgi:2-hydroxychromene-2-carboxylate isomerase
VLYVDVISLDSYRRARARDRQHARPAAAPLTFYFDLRSVYTYLAAERVDRMFAGVRWLPASAKALGRGIVLGDDERRVVRTRATLLGLPLVWPGEPPALELGAMRVAALAAERGVAAQFVLAASRLVFCGGYAIADPETLAEAAATAGIDWRDMLRAAGDVSRDGPIEEAGRLLLAAGADRLPAMRVGARLFCGEDRLSEVAAARVSA